MSEAAIGIPSTAPAEHGALFPGARATGIRQSDRTRWLMARHRGLGGSDVAALLGLHPYKSALEVYATKVGAMPAEKAMPEVALWGSIFEEPILLEYARRRGVVAIPSNELHARRDRPWHMFTPDGVTPDGLMAANDTTLDGPGFTEVKTTGDYTDWSEEGVPPHVQIQVQHGLMVTEAEWATLVWLPFPERRLQWIDYRPHREFIALLSDRVDQFWTRVVMRDPPDADGSASSLRALFALEPELVEECVELEGADQVADELEQINREVKLLESRKSLIGARVLQALGPYKVGLVAGPDGRDGRYWNSWRVDDREEKCVAGCGGTQRVVSGFRASRLMAPRKKPFSLPREKRVINLERDTELEALLRASLERVRRP